MGCGSSSVADAGSAASLERDGNHNEKSGHNGHIPNGNGVPNGTPKKNKPENSPTGKQVTANNEKNKDSTNQSVPKSIAFEVNLEEKDKKVDSIIMKNPPKRLQRLAPIDNAPTLTAEMLQEKLRLAEEKRQKEMDKKKEVSRRSSRLRQQILQAKQIDQQAEQQVQEIETKQKSASKSREAKKQEMEQKRMMREERARKVRERAQRMKEAGEGGDVDFEVEKDDHFNQDIDDVDSWLDGENNDEDRLYSASSSFRKPYKTRSAETRSTLLSASTIHSVDYRNDQRITTDENKKDDFFD